MLIQAITTQGAVSADYILTTSFVIIGALLTGFAYMVTRNLMSTLNQIQLKLSEHDEKFDQHHDKHSHIERELAVIKSEIARDNIELAELIVTKMRAVSPRGNG